MSLPYKMYSLEECNHFWESDFFFSWQSGCSIDTLHLKLNLSGKMLRHFRKLGSTKSLTLSKKKVLLCLSSGWDKLKS